MPDIVGLFVVVFLIVGVAIFADWLDRERSEVLAGAADQRRGQSFAATWRCGTAPYVVGWLFQRALSAIRRDHTKDVAQQVADYWHANNGWIPGAAREGLQDILGIPLDRANQGRCQGAKTHDIPIG